MFFLKFGKYLLADAAIFDCWIKNVLRTLLKLLNIINNNLTGFTSFNMEFCRKRKEKRNKKSCWEFDLWTANTPNIPSTWLLESLLNFNILGRFPTNTNWRFHALVSYTPFICPKQKQKYIKKVQVKKRTFKNVRSPASLSPKKSKKQAQKIKLNNNKSI